MRKLNKGKRVKKNNNNSQCSQTTKPARKIRRRETRNDL